MEEGGEFHSKVGHVHYNEILKRENCLIENNVARDINSPHGRLQALITLVLRAIPQ
jgi:hypothetical protein